MSDPAIALDHQLEQTCKLTNARWAFAMHRLGETWIIETQFGLTRPRMAALHELWNDPEISSWMAGTLQSNRVRWRGSASIEKNLSVQRIYVFPSSASQYILLVGADGLTKQAQAFFKILAMSCTGSTHLRSLSKNPAVLRLRKTEAQALNPQQKLLVELATAVSAGSEPSLIGKLVVDQLSNIFQTDRVGIFLRTVDGNNLREFGGQYKTYPVTFPIDVSLAGYVVETGESIRVGDVSLAPRFYDHQPDVQAAVAVPLKFHARTVGVIMMESDQRERFTADDEKYLRVIASQLSGIFEVVDLYQATQEWANNLSLIHKVVDQIVGLVDELQVAEVTSELLAEYFGYEFVIILVPDQGGGNLTTLGVGGSMAHLVPPGLTYSISQGITGRVFRTGQSYFSNDVSHDQDYFSINDWVAGSEICVPLRESDRVIGVLDLESSAKNTFAESDELLVESLAGILSSVLMNARRYQALEGSVNQLKAVRETGLDIIGNLDLDTLFNRVVLFARDLVSAKGAEIGLVDPGEQGIRVQTSINPWYDFTGHLIPSGKGIAGKVLETCAQVRVANYNAWDDRLWMGTLAPFKAAAGVPLVLKNQVIGTLVVMDDDENRIFSDGDMQTLVLLAQNIAIAIHNAQLYSELEERVEALKITESRLIQSEKIATAGRLTASIAHEINNPLQALQNCLYLTDRSGISSVEGKKYLSMARTELDRLVATVQRMMDYYRPGARDRELTNVNVLVKRVLALMTPQLVEQNILVHADLMEELPQVMVVSSQIQQVLLNLVINAMEAMPGGGTLLMRTAVMTTPGRRGRSRIAPAVIEIEVRDTGPGVPIELRTRLFEPFASTKDTGTGLGLAVSYGIIEAHGGTLVLVDDGSPGACFLITLPGGNQP